jgi:SAM-dependent methyltransferase
MNKDGNRRVENGRLVYYGVHADEKYWETHWDQALDSNFYAPYQKGHLWLLEKIFIHHLPKNGIILEAGCGTSQWVIALQARGYNCIGVDFAIKALQRARQFSNVPLFGSDLFQLGIAKDSLDAIISLGVVEHRQAGPGPYLKETLRVLKPGGLLLISVPYFHPLRQLRAAHGAYRDEVNGLSFYQQAFTREEFSQIIAEHGFEVVDWSTYEHRQGLRQELPWMTKIGSLPSRILFKLTDYIPYIRKNLGHMLILVGQKKK